jgi:hypothetical protein
VKPAQRIIKSLVILTGLFCLLANVSIARTIRTDRSTYELVAAFNKLIKDPYFERFTGLKIEATNSFDRDKTIKLIGGTQQFSFRRHTTTTTVKTDVDKSSTTIGGVDYIKTTTTKETTEHHKQDDFNIAYLPMIEFRENETGMRDVQVDCDFGDLDEQSKPGLSFGEILGAMLTGIGQGLSSGYGGTSQFSTSETTWSPFNPQEYATWLQRSWMTWRFKTFVDGDEDILDKAMKLYEAGNYKEALPLFEKLGELFPITRFNNNNEVVLSTTMPEIHAILGDLYRLYKKDMVAAEEHYKAAVNIDFMPYLKETRGLMIAHHGLGLIMAQKALRLKGNDADAFERVGGQAAFHLWAYLGWYGDDDAPDKAETLELIGNVDPIFLKRQELERQKQERYKIEEAARKGEQNKVKKLMEF